MSNDPLDSFVVSKPQSPDVDTIPSVKAEPIAKPKEPSRREPKLTAAESHSAAERITTHTDIEPEKPEVTTTANAQPTPERKPVKKTDTKKAKKRQSIGTRFAIYLGFAVATAFVLAIAGNAMMQSLEQLRDDVSTESPS